MNPTVEQLAENRSRVLAQIEASCVRAGRSPESVKLVAVSKTWPAQAIANATAAGLRVFGENYIQEAVAKLAELEGALPEGTEFHYIGHLQRNKARQAVGPFALLHSVDSLRLVETLDRLGKETGKPVSVLLEVSLAGEETKQGFEPEELRVLAPSLAHLEGVHCLGLMTMAPFVADPEIVRPVFSACRRLLEELAPFWGTQFTELSMGMSQDYQVAIEEGATLVRVGTALFGPRDYAH